MSDDPSRRTVIGTGLAAAAAHAASSEKPALLGGPRVRTEPFPGWPRIAENDERAWMEVLRKGRWNRLGGSYARQFEETWANALGAKHCLAVANGTSALIISLNALGVGPGDEVLVPPYTFVATINAVMMTHALPVFVDTDPESFQVDAGKIEAAITPRTRCILPVHMAGSPVDLDRILAIGRKHKLPVIEDACQAHFAEWRGKKVSTLGDLGCFSFQASKNLNSGEGGAILTNSAELYDICNSFHNNGRGKSGQGFSYVRNGANLRMTEFQAALLLTQFTRLEEQAKTRDRNAAYLTSQLKEIPGVRPAKLHDGCTRSAWHLYMFRYDKSRFANLPRERFLKAMAAEGIPCSPGYTPLNKEPLIQSTLQSRAFQRIYTAKEIAGYEARNACPVNDQLCQEAVWLTQTMLLGPRQDMDHIAQAIRKIQTHAAHLAA